MEHLNDYGYSDERYYHDATVCQHIKPHDIPQLDMNDKYNKYNDIYNQKLVELDNAEKSYSKLHNIPTRMDNNTTPSNIENFSDDILQSNISDIYDPHIETMENDYIEDFYPGGWYNGRLYGNRWRFPGGNYNGRWFNNGYYNRRWYNNRWHPYY